MLRCLVLGCVFFVFLLCFLLLLLLLCCVVLYCVYYVALRCLGRCCLIAGRGGNWWCIVVILYLALRLAVWGCDMLARLRFVVLCCFVGCDLYCDDALVGVMFRCVVLCRVVCTVL